MKSGASDPFADDDADEADGENASPPQSSSDESTGEKRSASGSEESDPEAQAGETGSAASASDESNAETDSEVNADADADATESEGLSREELPLILRRDKVKDERPEVHQLFVQRETHEEAVDAERALEKRLGEGLSRTDAREAIYLAGMRHLGDAEDILREWGYDL